MPQALVLGSPIAHSLSPALHTAAYAALGLTDWSFGAAEVDEAGFVEFVAGLDPDVRGLSLTMPLKTVAFEVAGRVSDRAGAAAAINTLIRSADGTWAADNTDIHGLVAALTGAGVEASAESGLILGGGASARSALLALRDLGVGAITVAARDPDKARASLDPVAERAGVTPAYVPLERWPAHPAAVVVSTLAPAGGDVAAGVLTLAGAGVLAGCTLLDIVYADWPTPLARAAEAAGAHVVSGYEMLVQQAAAQVELMTGRVPDAAVMRAAGLAALAAENR